MCAGAALAPVVVFAALLAQALIVGVGLADAAALDGLGRAALASATLVALAALIAFPLAVSVAVYIQEYADAPGDERGQGFVARLVVASVEGLAGVPSVIYGLLGLAVFVGLRGSGAGSQAAGSFAGVMTLAALLMPVIVASTRRALAELPAGLREAGLALGATRWQVIRKLVLPTAMPGILGGAVSALARGFGEAAPLLVLGLVASEALPVWVFARSSSAGGGIAGVAALLVVVLGLDVVALLLARRRARTLGGAA
nr:ABC transporter permease subunit [Pseudenhygromyxa sp. WMMC2535]